MSQNNYYHKIPGLLIPKDADFGKIHNGIDKYVDLIPNLIIALEKCSKDMDSRHDVFLSNMQATLLLLKDVYARSLETDAEIIIRSVKNDKKMEIAKKFFVPFVTKLTSLSVEMQKAQCGNEALGAAVSEDEAHADMANNLSAVGKMFDESDYEKAKNMISEIEDSVKDEALTRLSDLISSGKYDDAEVLLGIIKKSHIDAIGQSVVMDMSKTILAVDDMTDILSFINSALKNHYKVIGVTGAEKALKVIEIQKPDLFILDIDMPIMDGFELCRQIRATGNHSKTPIIFLTGNGSRDHITAAIMAGCNDFIVKPTSHETLLTKVNKFLT